MIIIYNLSKAIYIYNKILIMFVTIKILFKFEIKIAINFQVNEIYQRQWTIKKKKKTLTISTLDLLLWRGIHNRLAKPFTEIKHY